MKTSVSSLSAHDYRERQILKIQAECMGGIVRNYSQQVVQRKNAVARAFNPSTWEAQTGGCLNQRAARARQRNTVSRNQINKWKNVRKG